MSELNALTPQDIAERGKDIYRNRYQQQFEKQYTNKFVCINVVTGTATVSDASDDAVCIASHRDPGHAFHLMRIGHPAAFTTGW
jgi:hypothetical protein